MSSSRQIRGRPGSTPPSATGGEKEGDEGAAGGEGQGRAQWRRAQRVIEVEIPVGSTSARPLHTDLPDTGGMALVTSIRPVSFTTGLPAGTRSVVVFLVNYRQANPDDRRDESITFQAGLTVRLAEPFVPRPNLRRLSGNDWDEQVADLQYRDTFEYGVGHGVATAAVLDADGPCREITTMWIPSADVEKIAPAEVAGVELGMEALAGTCERSGCTGSADYPPLDRGVLMNARAVTSPAAAAD